MHSPMLKNKMACKRNQDRSGGNEGERAKTHTDAIIESAIIEGAQQGNEVHHHAQHGAQRWDNAKHCAHEKQRVGGRRGRTIL